MWKTSVFLAVSEDNISFLDGRYSFVPNFSIIAGEKASCKFLISVGYSWDLLVLIQYQDLGT